jgi:hypothetical protein
MTRIFAASTVVLVALLPAVVFAAPAHKRHIYRWHGYGFLPGYHQPPSNSVPVFSRKGRKGGTPAYVPSYYRYDGGHYYFGDPGFFQRRYNGGSFGPCWTWTPIGPIWNCG